MRFSRDGLRQSSIRWAILVCAALLFHAPAILFDVGNLKSDFLIHYRWAVEFSDSISDGQIYPRWMARSFFGLGAPSFLYYSPIFYFASALFRFFTGNTWDAMRCVFLASTVITGFFGYRILKRHTSERLALFGAVCLQMAPMIQMLFNYVCEIPWAVSFAALTALMYYATAPRAYERLFNIPIAVCVALLVATHVLSGFMLILCCSGYFLRYVRIGKQGLKIDLPAFSWTASVTLGLMLSSVYLFPALTALRYLHPKSFSSLLTPWDGFSFSIVTAMIYGIRWFSFQWPVSLVPLLCTAVATWFTLRRADKTDPIYSTLLFLLSSSWVAMFLASEFSYPIWIPSTPLRMLQFPHRFIYIASATSVLANVLVLRDVARDPVRRAAKCAVAIFPLLAGIGLTGILEAKMIFVDGQHLDLTSDSRSPYKGLQEYWLRTIAAKDRSHPRAKKLSEEGCFGQDAQCGQIAKLGNSATFHISTASQQFVRLPVFDFPAWRTTVDAAEAPISMDAKTGLISVPLPPGEHVVSLSWRRLPEEWIGLALTLLGLAVAFVVRFGGLRSSAR